MSNYCKYGAFYCPYRNGETDPRKAKCDGCKYAYTDEEWEKHLANQRVELTAKNRRRSP